MVRAILEGRKTQTRRIAKVPVGIHHGIDIMDWGLSKHPYLDGDVWRYNVQTDVDSYSSHELKCPYGYVDDVLYVRESIYQHGHYYTDSFDETGEYETRWISAGATSYVATDERPAKCRVKPSIHMPKKLARIFLKITDIRVERLQEIQPDDATAEGIEFVTEYLTPHVDGPVRFYKDYSPGCDTFEHANPVESFETLWRKINGDESWNENPFVWVISFEKIDKPTNV